MKKAFLIACMVLVGCVFERPAPVPGPIIERETFPMRDRALLTQFHRSVNYDVGAYKIIPRMRVAHKIQGWDYAGRIAYFLVTDTLNAIKEVDALTFAQTKIGSLAIEDTAAYYRLLKDFRRTMTDGMWFTMKGRP